MKLYIDTSSNKKTVVRLDNEELVSDSSIWKSQVVMPMIDKLLDGKDIKEITEIEINHGPGSFTGLRVGAAIANALGFALGIDKEQLIVYN